MTTDKLLNKSQIYCIANDYNDLWRGGAITDKDHCQVEDLIVSHLFLLAERDRYRAALEVAMRENQNPEIYKEVQKIIKGADIK